VSIEKCVTRSPESEGLGVGVPLGDGEGVGEPDGRGVGVGLSDGAGVGEPDGRGVGVGLSDGAGVGEPDGAGVELADGEGDGAGVAFAAGSGVAVAAAPDAPGSIDGSAAVASGIIGEKAANSPTRTRPAPKSGPARRVVVGFMGWDVLRLSSAVADQ
jgi:hypothetical protein